jgi:hypothetical protein
MHEQRMRGRGADVCACAVRGDEGQLSCEGCDIFARTIVRLTRERDGLALECEELSEQCARLARAVERLALRAERIGVGGCVRCHDARQSQKQLTAENSKLRAILARADVPCIYCGITDMSQCTRGFPGCARMDDLQHDD